MAELKKLTMKKEFLSYELEVELVKLGFNEKTFDVHSDIITQGFKVVKKPTPRILFQQASRFFREKYMLSGEIYIFKNIWNFDIEDINNSMQLYTSDIICYNSYEEAELACIMKLIEIAKEQNVK